MKKALIAIAFSVLSLVSPVEAAHRGSTVAVSSTPPVLTNTTVTFGQTTPSGRGSVLLSQMDQTIPSYIPTPVYGLGLQSPSAPPCDTWTYTFVSNSAGRPGSDFNVIAPNTPEGTGAIAPNPSGTGVNHLSGDYIWSVQCSNNGNASNTATLTYHTVANMVNVAQFDRNDFGWAPTNFGSVAGAKVVISTGADMHATFNRFRGPTLGSTPTQYLTFTVADPARPPYISNLTTLSLSNILMTGIIATGNTDIAIQNATSIFGGSGTCTNYTIDNVHYYGSPLMTPTSSNNSGQSLFNAGCQSGGLIQNSSGDFVNSGSNISDGYHYSNLDIGHYQNNCFAIGSAPLVPLGSLVDGFTTCHDGLLSFAGQHTDAMQILDGATAASVTGNNFWAIQASSTGFPQGPWFGGAQGGSTGSNGRPWAGYIDDGTGAHGPGTILTFTAGTGTMSSSAGSQIWSPGNISIADNVRINSNNASVTGLSNIAATNIGSPGSPVNFFNVGAKDVQLEGIVNTQAGFHGLDSPGESGNTFIKHFAVVKQNPNPFASTSFTAAVNGVVGVYPSGTTITVAGSGTASAPGVNEPIIVGGLNYSGCPASGNAACNTAPNGQGTPSGLYVGGEYQSLEPVQATGTATFAVSGGLGKMTIAGPCTGRWDYNITNGSHLGGLMVAGTGIPDGVFIVTQLFLPSDGCAGVYTLSTTAVGTLSSRAVTGRPVQGAGIYGLANYGTGATPTGNVAMTSTPYAGLSGMTGWVAQSASGTINNCVAGLHQGAFLVANGYANGGINLCGAPVTNTTQSNNATPTATDYLTGVLPFTSLTATNAATWDAMTTAQKRAYTCNKMLPKPGGILDLGGGDWIGPFTGTGEVILAGGNIAVTGCGIH